MTITFGPGSIAIIASAAAIAAIALMIALALRAWVLKQDEGSDGMHAIAEAVQEGAQAYLARQLRTLAPIAGVVFVLLFVLPGETSVRVGRSVAFLSGAAFSGAIGYLGMWLAVRANVRVAAASRKPHGKSEGAKIAFRTGGVVGMCVVGLGLLGVCLALLVFMLRPPVCWRASVSGPRC